MPMPAMNDSDLFWRDILTAAGFPVRNLKRCNAVARVISANKFRRLEQLGNAPSVETWACCDRLQEDELLQLQFFCTRQQGGSDSQDTADSPPNDSVSDGDSPPDRLHPNGARGTRLPTIILSSFRFCAALGFALSSLVPTRHRACWSLLLLSSLPATRRSPPRSRPPALRLPSRLPPHLCHDTVYPT